MEINLYFLNELWYNMVNKLAQTQYLWLISETTEYIVNVVANKPPNIGNNRCNYGLIFRDLCVTIGMW